MKSSVGLLKICQSTIKNQNSTISANGDGQMTDQTRRTFLRQAVLGTAAVLAYPPSTVLGANDRVRVGMIGVGDRGNDLLGQVRGVHGVELVAMADVYSRRRDEAKSKVSGIQTFDD